MEVTDYDPVECPVADCEFRDRIRSVAGHVSETGDDRHSWSRLGYDGARDFVMTEKRRQRVDGDESGGASGDGSGADDRSGASGTSDATPAPRDPDDDEEAFELGFERDALVLVSLVREYDFETLDDLDTFRLANLYTLLSDLKGSAESARKEVRDALLEELQDDRTVSSDMGSLSRRTYRRRSLKDEDRLRAALDDAGIDPEEVRSFDKKKLREAAEEGDLDESAVFDVEERAQIRKGDTDDERRRERFGRLPEELRSFAEDR